MKYGTNHGVCLRLTLPLILLPSALSATPAQEAIPSFLPEAQIREVSARILKKADKAGCKPRDCRIVAANFVFSSGLTSQLGKELADQFSREFALQRHAMQIIDRSQLDSILERQRIPGASLNNDQAIRWLGQAVGATSILTGTLEESSTSLGLKVRLLSCFMDKAGPEESIIFSYSGLSSDLDRMEAFPQQLPVTNIFADSSIRQAGSSGVTHPSCVYCPNPNYTDAARKVKFSGRVVLEVVVSEQGQPLHARIIRGVPYGLNEASVDAVRSWKFKPAMFNGKPAAVKVPVEVSFNIR